MSAYEKFLHYIEDTDWNKETAYHVAGMAAMLYIDGQISMEELEKIREKIPLTDEDYEKINVQEQRNEKRFEFNTANNA